MFKNILFQWVLVLVLSVAAFVLQTTFLQYISLADVAPNLLLVIVVSLAYIKGSNAGMAAGFLCGLLPDLMYGDLIGINSLICLVIGYLAGLVHKIYDPEDVTFPILITAAADFIYGLLYYVFHFLFRNRLDFMYYMRRIIFPEMVYTVVLSALVYKGILKLLFLFERKQEE